MKSMFPLCAILLVLIGTQHVLAQTTAEETDTNDNAGGDSPRVEFRVAEPAASEGLSEASIVGSDERLYLHPSPVLTKDHIVYATASGLGDSEDNLQPAITIKFTEEGGRLVSELTSGRWLGSKARLAVLVDGKVVAAPVIQEKLSSNCVITGNFTLDEATEISRQISPRPPFHARMLLVKRDWLHGLKDVQVVELAAEIRKSLDGASVPENLLDQLPETALEILFPRRTISLYTPAHYADLLAWLKLKELVVAEVRFPHPQVMPVATAVGAPEPTFPSYGTSLTRPAKFLIADNKLETLFQHAAPRLFVTQHPEFTWHVSQEISEKSVSLSFLRQSNMRHQKRGQDGAEFHHHDETRFHCTVPPNHVAVMNAFAKESENAYIGACLEETGCIPLIVTLPITLTDEASGSAVAAVRPPDVIETIAPIYTRAQRSAAYGNNLQNPRFNYSSSSKPRDFRQYYYKAPAANESYNYGAPPQATGGEGVPALRVTGAVLKPGEWAGDAETRLLDAISMAGGLNDEAGNEAIVRRNANGAAYLLRIDLDEATRDNEYNVPLNPGDVVTVPPKSGPEQLATFALSQADPESVVSTLRQFYAGEKHNSRLKIDADATNKRILVFASSETLDEIRELIERIDKPHSDGTGASLSKASAGSGVRRGDRLRREFADAFGFGDVESAAAGELNSDTDVDSVDIQLKTAKAASVDAVLQEVYRDVDLELVVNDDKNSLRVAGDKAVLEEVLGLTAKIDDAFAFDSKVRIDKLLPGGALHTGGTLQQAQAVAQLLRDLYQASEQSARETADRLQEFESKTNQSETTSALTNVLKDQLRKEVAKSFELRQAYHEMELSVMQSKLQRTRNSLDQRKRIKDQIIRRRVKDLLTPSIQR